MTSLGLTISCFSHSFRNKTSIDVQLPLSSSGKSSNHSSASLLLVGNFVRATADRDRVTRLAGDPKVNILKSNDYLIRT
jgi:hypothetical protein